MKNNTENELNVEEYSVSEVCYFTGAKRQEIYQDIDKGIVKAYRKGNKYYFLKKDIDEYKKYLGKKSNEVLKKVECNYDNPNSYSINYSSFCYVLVHSNHEINE